MNLLIHKDETFYELIIHILIRKLCYLNYNFFQNLEASKKNLEKSIGNRF